MLRITRNHMNSMLYGTNRSQRRSRTNRSSRYASDILNSATSQSVFPALYGNRFMNANALNRISQNQTGYQNMKNNAGWLQNTVNQLRDSSDSSLFAKAAKSGSTEEITNKVKEFADYYNGMVWNLRSSGSKVDSSYLNMLNSYAVMNQSALQATGVTRKADGTLSVDEKTLQSATLEQFQKAWNGSNSFATKAGTTAAYVEDNAVSGLNSLLANSYSSLLGSFGNRGNFFNFWT